MKNICLSHIAHVKHLDLYNIVRQDEIHLKMVIKIDMDFKNNYAEIPVKQMVLKSKVNIGAVIGHYQWKELYLNILQTKKDVKKSKS